MNMFTFGEMKEKILWCHAYESMKIGLNKYENGLFDYSTEFKQKVIGYSILESIEKGGEHNYEFIDNLSEKTGHALLKSIALWLLSDSAETKERAMVEISFAINRNLLTNCERDINEMLEDVFDKTLSDIEQDYKDFPHGEDYQGEEA